MENIERLSKETIESISMLYSKKESDEFTSFIYNFKTKILDNTKIDGLEDKLLLSYDTVLTLTKIKASIDCLVAGFIIHFLDLKDKNDLSTKMDLPKVTISLIDNILVLEKYSLPESYTDVSKLRSMLLLVIKDIRSVFIQLARIRTIAKYDYKMAIKEKTTLHNQIKFIYAPLAARLGLSYIKSDLENMNLLFFEEEEYKKLKNIIKKTKQDREELLDNNISKVEGLLAKYKIEGKVTGRVKQVSSVYQKIKTKTGSFDKVLDLIAIRVIVDNTKDCYTALFAVHSNYTPLPNTFKDYISRPKDNGYSSIHTTLDLGDKNYIEVQIRTKKMHDHAEYGVAAHWLYKENSNSKNIIDEKLLWIRRLLEDNKDITSEDVLDALNDNSYIEDVYVQTPKGKIIKLPYGATPIDFAYSIHSEIGNKCIGAKVNNKLVTLDTILNNGEMCEILTSKSSKGPSRDWLSFTVTSQAKNRIKNYFKQTNREESIKNGRYILETNAKTKGIKLSKFFSTQTLEEIKNKHFVDSIEEIYFKVGQGALTSNQILSKIKEEQFGEPISNKPQETSKKDLYTKSGDNAVVVGDMGNIMTTYAKCCSPIPKDNIVAYISRGKGAIIHRSDCGTLDQYKGNRIITARWGKLDGAIFLAEFSILVYNKSGVLALISKVYSSLNLDIISVNSSEISSEKSIIYIRFKIKNYKEFHALEKKLENIKNVIEVTRVFNS